MRVQSKNLDYYGIISGISQKIELVKIINSITKSDPQRKVSIGHGALALILNGAGLTLSKPVYLTGNFFHRKPIELLLGEDIATEDLNDDSLDRALDALYRHGCDKICYTIAYNAALKYEVDLSRLHADTSVMQLYGDYSKEDAFITFGYAKQGRIDLKQFLLSLVVSADGAIPIFFEALAGNETDNKHFKSILGMFEGMLKDPKSKAFYAIFDCKMYSKENLKEINRVLFVTRVPEAINEAKEAKVKYISLDGMESYGDYKLAEISSNYGEIEQRWVVVYSKEAHERSQKAVNAKAMREKEKFEKSLKKINCQKFACEKDAKNAVAQLSKQYKLHEITIIEITKEDKVKRKKNASQSAIFKIRLQLTEKFEEVIKQAILGGMFVLSTNQLDKKALATTQILDYYKDQSLIENRFNVFKNAACFAPKVYLKRRERIVALAMVICLGLLVYSLAERQLRNALKATNATIPNQSGKPIKNPTMKWVYHLFEGVAVVTIHNRKKILREITNLSSLAVQILTFLGDECMSIYNLSPDQPIDKKN